MLSNCSVALLILCPGGCFGAGRSGNKRLWAPHRDRNLSGTSIWKIQKESALKDTSMERALLFVRAVALLMGARASNFNLTISATGRMSGKLYPNDKYGTMADGSMVNANGSTSETSWSTVYGGPAKVAAEIKRLRESRENVLSVDLGGFYFKQAFYSYDGIQSAARVYNMINYDVATLELRDLYGCELTCTNYAEWTRTIGNSTSFLAANIDYTKLRHPLNASRLSPWDVKVVGGRKVGFVGFVNIELRRLAKNSVSDDVWPIVASAWTDTQTNEDPWTTDPLAFAIQDLQGIHPDCNIIVFAGQSVDYSGDNSWARSMFASYPELDAIISAANEDIATSILSRTNYFPDAAAAFIHVPDASSAGAYSDGAMSVASMVFDDNGHLVSVEQDMLPLGDEYPADQEIWAYIESIYPNATAGYKEVVSSSSIFVNGFKGNVAEEGSFDDDTMDDTITVPGCRISDCSMGRLINMANIDVCTDCDFAIQNVRV